MDFFIKIPKNESIEVKHQYVESIGLVPFSIAYWDIYQQL